MTDRAHLFSVICSVFTYLVVGCCFYYFRTLEFLLGSYIYLTFLFSSSVCILLIHFLQLWIYDPGYGCISLICALLVVYWSISFSSSLRLEIVPSIKNASTVVRRLFSCSFPLRSLSLVGLLVYWSPSLVAASDTGFSVHTRSIIIFCGYPKSSPNPLQFFFTSFRYE